MATSSDIRQQFIDFFVQRHGHRMVPSSPVVPHHDPTLLFANAGMNQFKDVFLGTGKRDYTRAVNTQKCIRAGGKHNDLEDVGKDTYHHTFFEMLGNWSFGDYFKQEAIAWGWELLTEVWGIDKSRLHATVFGGDPTDGLEPDEEAVKLWKTATDIDPSHIHYGSKKDNFWEMGDTGPCGPCSEIHIDLTPDKTGADLINQDDPRVIEIWNLVFIQFNRDSAGKLSPLPAKHVDTGMGLERLCAVLQGKSSNYDTDLFTPIFEAIRDVTGARPYGGQLDDKVDTAYRIIADHARCLTFALTDGAIPSNEGRGYVLRRILRRAVRHGWQTLGTHEPFLHRLVPVVVDHMAGAFPELKDNPNLVIELVKDEEENFGRTQERGIEILDDRIRSSELEITRQVNSALESLDQSAAGQIQKMFDQSAAGQIQKMFDQSAAGQIQKMHDQSAAQILKRALEDVSSIQEAASISDTLLKSIESQEWSRHGLHLFETILSRISLHAKISAEDAFMLHDTYGFPLDLTQVMAAERGMTVDVDGFNRLMEQAREKSRGAGGQADATQSLTEIVQKENLPATRFVGYDRVEHAADTACRIYRLSDNGYRSTDSASVADRVAVVMDETPFYSEAGGQVGDTGVIEKAGSWSVNVEDTAKVGDVYFHLGRVVSGRIDAQQDQKIELHMQVDPTRRAKIMANHTGTHLMNRALRDVLGDHVQQKGSLVDDTKLRFDFSHNAAVSTEQIDRIEESVNTDIGADLPVYAQEADQEEALKIRSLRAVFGEKYPPRVRVVSIGAPVEDLLAQPDNQEWEKYSIEFCGGTHLAKTGDAEGFVITQEEAVAKGVRRITALTGPDAHRVAASGQMLEARLEGLENQPLEKLPDAVAGLVESIEGAALPLLTRQKLRDGITRLQKKIKDHQKQQSKASAGAAVEAARSLAERSDGQVIVAKLNVTDAADLRAAMDVVRKKRPEAALLLGAVAGDKVAFVRIGAQGADRCWAQSRRLGARGRQGCRWRGRRSTRYGPGRREGP